MSADHLSITASIGFGAFDLDLDQPIPLTGVTAIVGPSGAGKSTLLRIIAGFEKPARGRITLGNDVWFDSGARINIPAYKRPVGYMFQSGRLFSHLTARDNLQFADKRSSTVNSAITVEKVIHQFELYTLLDRNVTSLSGGERQRVALARTILTRPAVLLLDEPLAALDVKRKRDILPFLEALPRSVDIPIIYVSHDMEEVCRIADTMMVLEAGRVQAFGPALKIVNDRALSTGEDGDCLTLLEGTVHAHDRHYQLAKIAVGDGEFSLPLVDAANGAAIRLRVHARDVALSLEPPTGLSIQNVIPGVITGITQEDRSAYGVVTLDIGAQILRARITRASIDTLGLKTGIPVYALIKSASFEQ